MMLYPDMSRALYERSDTFAFAAPCTHDEWHELYIEVSRRWRNRKSTDPESQGKTDSYLPWLMVADDSEERVCIVLQDRNDTDDEAETTAAWVRVSEEFNGMIYALKYDPAYRSNETLASVITRTAGVNPSQVRHIQTKRRNLV